MDRRLLNKMGPLVAGAFFVAALLLLHHQLQAYEYDDVLRSVRDMADRRLWIAAVLTALSYLALAHYDVLAFRYIRRPVPYAASTLGGFVGYAFSVNGGFPLVTGGSVRYRIYSAWNLTALDIGKIMAFAISTYWFGLLALGAVSFLWEPLPLPERLGLPFATTQPLGVTGAVLVAAYLALSAVRRTPIRVRGIEMQLPSPWIAAGQVALAAVDLLLAAGVLYALLPVQATISYPAFLGIYLLANVAGILSQVPGGLGVFESIMLLFLSGSTTGTAILAALLAFRAIYYFAPLAVAGLLLGGYEAYRGRRFLGRLAGLLGPWAPIVAPQILAYTTFAGGAILVVTGATPADLGRLAILGGTVPLAVVEAAHALHILAGLGLLFVARPLQERVRYAYYATGALLTVGIVASILKGLDYEEAVLPVVALALLLPFQSVFYRRISLLGPRLTLGWAGAIAAVVVVAAWVGLFTHRAVDYHHGLWSQFALEAQASRLLRASLVVPVFLLVLGLVRLMRPRAPEPMASDGDALARAESVAAASPEAAAALALVGDKTLLFSESGQGLIMYTPYRRFWIAYGDPLGPSRDRVDLVWQFHDLCERRGVRPMFYHVSEDHLPLYVDIGLTLLKFGEEAVVPLEDASLDRGRLREFRYLVHRLEREGLSFEVVEAGVGESQRARLREVSDRWRAWRRAGERAFSVGRFDDGYLWRLPLAVVRRGDQPVAFAPVWAAAEGAELAADFVRHQPDAPEGILDYVLVHLMLWGVDRGYGRFSLGLAPLAGADAVALAPLWNRIAALHFRHQEHFHDLRALRDYKARFRPEWQPRYLATPGGVVMSRALRSIGAVIGEQ